MLIGNLGQKPELRQTNSNLAVTRLSIATTERRKGADGNWTNQTEWHNVVVFGRQAENCAQFLDKGRQVYVEGRLQTRKYQDKDGNDRRSTLPFPWASRWGRRGFGANMQLVCRLVAFSPPCSN